MAQEFYFQVPMLMMQHSLKLQFLIPAPCLRDLILIVQIHEMPLLGTERYVPICTIACNVGAAAIIQSLTPIVSYTKRVLITVASALVLVLVLVLGYMLALIARI